MTLLETIIAERDAALAALAALVGASQPDELKQIEAVIRSQPVPAEDKAAMVDAIHALLKPRSDPKPLAEVIANAREYYSLSEIIITEIGTDNTDKGDFHAQGIASHFLACALESLDKQATK